MTETDLKIGDVITLSYFKTEPKVTVLYVDRNVFYTFNNEKCYSPLTSVRRAITGWYTLETYCIDAKNNIFC